MKLRIRENSIRLRLTKSEVVIFADKGLIENSTEFLNSNNFIYAIKSSDSVTNLEAVFNDGRIEIIIPKQIVLNWAETEDVGISGSSGVLKILIEKDFACLTVREGEDETDAFPNPSKKTC
jgi:hypothetical protein